MEAMPALGGLLAGIVGIRIVWNLALTLLGVGD